MTTEQLVVRHTAPKFAYGWWRNVSIGAWGGAPSFERLQHVRRGQEALRARYPGGFAVVNLVRVNGGVQSLDAPARAESEAMIKHFAGAILAIATVLEGGGFVASLTRSVLAAQRLVARVRYPEKVFDRATDAPAWLLPLALGRAPTADDTRDLAAAIDGMWRALGVA